MQDRRTAPRFRTNIIARWETLKTEGRGSVSDFSSTGCFVLSGGELVRGELVRLEIKPGDETHMVWGYVVYYVPEIGFALRFAFVSDDEQRELEELQRILIQE